MRLYGGIDLHSNNHMVTLIDEQDRRVFERRLGNDIELTRRTLEPFREHLVAIAVESTFNWYWLVDGLMDSGYELRLVNTAAVQHYSGLKHCDDRHDARWLAHLLRLGILPTGYIYPKEQRAVRDLARQRLRLVQLRSVLERVKLDEPYRNLMTVNGIGPILALTIMLEVGPITRFASVGQFASYCRCVESIHSSNGKKKGEGNRKNGNPHLAWAFHEAAHFAVRYLPAAQRFYARKARERNSIVAMKALAHKLARACYYVLRDGVPFVPERLFGS